MQSIDVRIGMFLMFALAGVSAAPGRAEPVSFRRDIAPMMLDNCLACHGPKKAEGNYRVDSFERLLKAGDSELPTVTAKGLGDSELFRRITTDDEGERMPLEGEPLPEPQVALLQRWIEEGAMFDGDDPAAPLASIVPPPRHPDPPAAYPNTVPVTAVAFSVDGKELYVGGYHEVTVWNPADGQLLRRIPNVGERTYSLVPSPDGKLLAVGCGSPGRLGETRIFDSQTGELRSVLGVTSDVVLDVAFNPQGDRLAMGAADGVIRVFEVATGTQQLAISSHSDWVMALAWNADGTRIASASRDKTAKVFDAANGELLVTYAGHGEPVKGVAFHPDGAQVYSAGSDKKIHRWQISDGAKKGEVGFGNEVYKLALGGEFLFASSADKTARQFEAGSQKEVRSFSGHQDWVLCAAYHDATKRLATGGFDGEVRVWNTEDGQLIVSFVAAPGYVGAE